jgi:hypothetical protein
MEKIEPLNKDFGTKITEETKIDVSTRTKDEIMEVAEGLSRAGYECRTEFDGEKTFLFFKIRRRE